MCAQPTGVLRSYVAVERHLIRGELLISVWRGQMGLSEEEQENFVKKACEDCSCSGVDM
jgi:hypothetical protein